MPKLLKYKIAVKEAAARFGYGTSRYMDFMIGWTTAYKKGCWASKSMRRHGHSYRHQKRKSD